MKKRLRFIATIAFLSIAFLGNAQRYFMKVEGPNQNGLATEPKHANEFEISSFSFGVSNGATISGTTINAGNPQFTGFSITMNQSKNVAKLYKYLHSGQKFTTVTISTMRNFTDGLDDELIFTLDSVHFANVNYNISDSDDKIKLSANLFSDKVKIQHYLADNAGDRELVINEAKWNIVENMEY